MTYSPTLIALYVTVILLVGLTILAWRFRTQPSAKLFGIQQFLSALWAALATVGLLFPQGSTQLRIWGLKTGLSLIVVFVWFAFILSYTGRESFLRSRRIGIILLPLAVGAGLYFVVPSWRPLVGQLEQTTSAVGTVVEASIGPVGAFLGIYIYFIFLAGLAIIVKTILESNRLFVGQAIALFLGSVVTIGASFLTILGVPEPGYPTTEVALGGQAVLWGYAVFGQQFLQIAPAVAAVGERAAFDDLEDGIIIVDSNGVITRANPASRTYIDTEEMGGETVESVLERVGVGTLDDLPTQFQFQGQTYRATRSSITNWRGDTIGHSVLIQDITPLIRRQQRLQVLTRILRHNVRNNMTVVQGMSRRLRNDNPADLTTISKTIDENVTDLIRISEKATELDKILDETSTTKQVDLEAIISDTISPLATHYPNATFQANMTVKEVMTDPRLLSLVLKEVITNAVEYTGDAPEITIATERLNDHVEITVADDGPGIPQIEIDPITAGEETDLQHASSLGLWVVYWGMQELGGDVEFTTTDNGSTVTLSLPRNQNT